MHSKTRRDFLKKSISAGVAAGGALLFGPSSRLLAANEAATPDLAAVKNAEPDLLFKKAIELMGGMKRFVRKGQTVLVKPNIGFNKRPEFGATTNPLLVKTIVEHCYSAGAKKVYVFDRPGTYSHGIEHKCYQNSGIEEAAKSAGGLVVPANNEKYFQKIDIPGGKALESIGVHELVLESDVFINVPVLKSHNYAHLTIAIKNLMGVIWDQGLYHYLDLDQCIADFLLFRKPDLNIVDAYRVMEKDGPQGKDESSVTFRKTLLISPDIVAVDTAAARVFGMEPEKVKYLQLAAQAGHGTMNLEKLKIEKHAFPG